jgi:Lrp/AsnC family transcriptional regulator, leucine-responsive regulatory protein
VQRLERAGVIRGYRVDVDPVALGLPVTAFARIRPTAGQLPRIAELAAAMDQVSECHRLTGEDCFLIKVHAPSVQQLEDVLDRFPVYGSDRDLDRGLHPCPGPGPAARPGSPLG